MMKRGFTLLEMLIALSIFALISLYLYKSLETLQGANTFYAERLDAAKKQHRAIRSIYLDLTLAHSVDIVNEDKALDIVIMQTAHSLHRRILPYVAYRVVEGVLYRMESSKKLGYPFDADLQMSVDRLGDIKQLRIYRNIAQTHYLLDLGYSDGTESFVKVRALNQHLR